MTDETPAPRLFVKNKYNNTVLNWHREPEKEFHLYGEAFWNAAKNLLQNEALDKRPIASFDASVIVYLYRHALELFLKETRFVWFGLVLSETVEKAARSFGL